jgi:predicted metal-binding protein
MRGVCVCVCVCGGEEGRKGETVIHQLYHSSLVFAFHFTTHAFINPPLGPTYSASELRSSTTSAKMRGATRRGGIEEKGAEGILRVLYLDR